MNLYRIFPIKESYYKKPIILVLLSFLTKSTYSMEHPHTLKIKEVSIPKFKPGQSLKEQALKNLEKSPKTLEQFCLKVLARNPQELKPMTQLEKDNYIQQKIANYLFHKTKKEWVTKDLLTSYIDIDIFNGRELAKLLIAACVQNPTLTIQEKNNLIQKIPIDKIRFRKKLTQEKRDHKKKKIIDALELVKTKFLASFDNEEHIADLNIYVPRERLCQKAPLLWYAADSNNYFLAKLLIDLGAEMNVRDNLNQEMPIHRASRSGATKITKFLLKNGVDPNSLSYIIYYTPLYCATMTNKPKIVKILLKNNAKKDLRPVTSHLTPLEFAKQYNREELVALLLK